MLRTISLIRWKAPQPLKGLWVASAVLCVPNLYDWGKSVHLIFCKLRKSQGTVTAQNLFKGARWLLTKQYLGDPVPRDVIKRDRIPVDRYGYPLYLPLALRQTLRGNPSRLERAMSLFLLSLYLCYTGKRPVSLTAITQPSEAEWETEKEYRRLVPTLALMLGLTEPLRLHKPKLFATNRGGPNGHALLASHLDAVALEKSEDTGRWFHKWVREVWPVEGTVLSRRVSSLARLTLDLGLVSDAPLFLGKIGLKREPVKNRLFAISDYWTQVALLPLHDALMEVLRSISSDATWNQDGGAVTIQKWSAEGKELWSYDLTAATDRFPRTLQAALLDYLMRAYGTGFGQVWSLLLTNRGYRMPGSRTQTCKYRAGQPMGTLSSWAMFALTHHTVVQWAALQAGWKTTYVGYQLLGDDIVIADGAVARAYEILMSQLGVKINRTKSVHAVGGAEFAKRSFAGGTELTGLSWNLFGHASASMVALYTLCTELQRRVYEMDWTGILMVVLGRPGDRKVSRPVRSLLLALLEMAGPCENPDVWWASRFASTTKEWFDTAIATSTIDDRILRAATHCLGLKSLKAERLLMLGRTLVADLAGQLDGVLLAQLEDVLVRREIATSEVKITPEEALNRVRLITAYRTGLRELSLVHPAREVCERFGETPSVSYTPDPRDLEEFLVSRRALTIAPQHLLVLTRSDSEQIHIHRDVIQHATDRMNACVMRLNFGYFDDE